MVDITKISGEINTLRGNKNWMLSREGNLKIPKELTPLISFDDKKKVFEAFADLKDLFPIIEPNGSDSSALDNVAELIHLLSPSLLLHETLAIMIPEALTPSSHLVKSPIPHSLLRDFYEWAACISEPWDGPALVTFSDGERVGARLDRNGLRPCRYLVLDDGLVILASETGTLTSFSDNQVIRKGRLEPGRTFLVDMSLGSIFYDDVSENEEASRGIFKRVCNLKNFTDWIQDGILTMKQLSSWWCDVKTSISPQYSLLSRVSESNSHIPALQDPRLKGFGFTMEQLNFLIIPMVLIINYRLLMERKR